MAYINRFLADGITVYDKDTIKESFKKSNIKASLFLSDIDYDASNLTKPILKKVNSVAYSFGHWNYIDKTDFSDPSRYPNRETHFNFVPSEYSTIELLTELKGLLQQINDQVK